MDGYKVTKSSFHLYSDQFPNLPRISQAAPGKSAMARELSRLVIGQYYYNNTDHIINLESLKKIKKLVISLNDDMMIDCSLTQMGANLLGADIQSFDNIGHAVPFSNLWKDVAEYISLWS